MMNAILHHASQCSFIVSMKTPELTQGRILQVSSLLFFYDDGDTDVEINIFVKKSVVMNQNSIRVMSKFL